MPEAVVAQRKNCDGMLVPPRTFGVVDEFRSLGKNEAIFTTTRESRSKGYVSMIGVQNPNTLIPLYEQAGVSDLISMLSTWVLLHNEGDAADTVAKWSGDREVIEIDIGQNDQNGDINRTARIVQENVIKGEEIRKLGQLNSGVLEALVKYVGQPPIKVAFRKEDLQTRIFDVEERAREEYPVFEPIKKVDPKAFDGKEFPHTHKVRFPFEIIRIEK